jgi:hypothetical protein
MKKPDTNKVLGVSLGMMAVCCGGHLLLLLGLPLLAALTGQIVLLALATAVLLVGGGILLWRQRHGRCTQTRSPEAIAPADQGLR